MSPSDDALDQLYEAPLEEFTSRRNELAKELAASGDKSGAREVKALAKPSGPAWILNQLARSNTTGIDKLLETGERLRAAQRGEGGEGGDLRSLHAQVRDQVAKLLAEAQSITSSSGRQTTTTLKNRLMQSLMAAAADEDAGARVRAGRLTREPEPGGFEAAGDVFVSAPSAAAPSPRRKEAEARAASLREEADAAQAEADLLAQEAERAERAAQRARTSAKGAAAAAEAKRARAEAAARALEEV